MDLYRRIAAIRSQEDADDLLDELVDRFGEPPQGALNLIAVALLRAQASACGISDITQKSDQLRLTLDRLDFSAVSALCADPALRDRVRFSAGEQPVITYRMKKGEEPLGTAQRFLRQYAAMISAEDSSS